ncbi:MAG: hypothetical protein EOO88_41520 [Pedobacter sp.]|nr:MAG: hypothetical protein EOO88_41520 [Pedobacter sp.]
MKASYLFLLTMALACQSGHRHDQSQSIAVRDLLIDRVFWKPLPTNAHSDTLVNQHTFTITNTSAQHTYSQIQVRFNYYDANYHRIDSAKYVVAQPIEPRSAVTIRDVQMGNVNPATKSSTVTVERAESE